MVLAAGSAVLKTAACVLACTLACALAIGSSARAAQDPGKPLRVRVSTPAPVVVFNRTIVTLRAAIDNVEPAARAVTARSRIESLSEDALDDEIRASPATLGEHSGFFVSSGPFILFGLLPEDVDPESGKTLESLGQEACASLRATIAARAEQRSLPRLLRGIGLALLASALFVVTLWLIRRARDAVQQLLRAMKLGLPEHALGVDLVPLRTAAQRTALRVASIALALFASYLWLAFVLAQFPYTSPWGEGLGGFLRDVFVRLGTGAVAAVPGLFTVLVILLLTRLVVRAVNRFFASVEAGKTSVAWLERETARATRRLVVVLVWILALTAAYPYVPGSNSDAFKGLSVFMGLVISLGSAGLVNQAMSGLVIVYARACRNGDFVKVGEIEGLVSSVGVLSTKIVNYRKEEITIPNSVLVGGSLTNYTRLADADGPVAATTVTIGYDAPWRQVHALLELAAERTAGLRREPKPRVLQRALGDFYVEYQLLVNLERAEDRPVVLSELHGRIQDAFNEFGVQIMSPHFETQPAGAMVVPRSKWHERPAAGPAPESGS